MDSPRSDLSPVPILAVDQGKPFVSSLKLAQHFGKRHADVIRRIKALIDELPPEFNERNFAPVEYPDAKGEMRPAFNLTRDAFTLLAMGFTGKPALAWKLRYIEAFNAMEAELRKRPRRPGRPRQAVKAARPALPLAPERLPRAMQEHIDWLVRRLLSHSDPNTVPMAIAYANADLFESLLRKNR